MVLPRTYVIPTQAGSDPTKLIRYLRDQLKGSLTVHQYELKLAKALEFVRRPVPAP